MTTRVTAIQAIRANTCARCGAAFVLCRSDVRYCSGACRQAAWRAARPRIWAVVTWYIDKPHHEIRAQWTRHATREQADRAAPHTGEPFTVVNVAREPWIDFPSIEDLVRRNRPLIEQRKWTL